MRKRPTKTGNAATGGDKDTTPAVSTTPDVIDVAPQRAEQDAARLDAALDSINARYAAVFNRLAE